MLIFSSHYWLSFVCDGLHFLSWLSVVIHEMVVSNHSNLLFSICFLVNGSNYKQSDEGEDPSRYILSNCESRFSKLSIAGLIEGRGKGRPLKIQVVGPHYARSKNTGVFTSLEGHYYKSSDSHDNQNNLEYEIGSAARTRIVDELEDSPGDVACDEDNCEDK